MAAQRRSAPGAQHALAAPVDTAPVRVRRARSARTQSVVDRRPHALREQHGRYPARPREPRHGADPHGPRPAGAGRRRCAGGREDGRRRGAVQVGPRPVSVLRFALLVRRPSRGRAESPRRRGSRRAMRRSACNAPR